MKESAISSWLLAFLFFDFIPPLRRHQLSFAELGVEFVSLIISCSERLAFISPDIGIAAIGVRQLLHTLSAVFLPIPALFCTGIARRQQGHPFPLGHCTRFACSSSFSIQDFPPTFTASAHSIPTSFHLLSHVSLPVPQT